jgi:hypothetical protein
VARPSSIVAILPQRREIAGEPPPGSMRLWHNGR